MPDLPMSELLLRLLLGVLYGGGVGLERQINGRPAGFRTHILICVASVLLMELSEYYQYLSYMNPEYVRLDPGRIAAGAITGIGFIGAGVIIKMGANVLGLTTAASLWMVSAIGFSVGAGFYMPALAAFGVTVFSLFILRLVERITPGIVFKSLTIKAAAGVDEEAIKEVLKRFHTSLYRNDYEVDNSEQAITLYYTISIRRRPMKEKTPMKRMAEEVAAIEGVRKVSLRV